MEKLKTSVFSYGEFSKQKYSTRSYYYRCVEGREGGVWEISPALSRKLEKSSLILGKRALIVAIYWLNFSFKMHVFLGGKTRNFFLLGPSFFCVD